MPKGIFSLYNNWLKGAFAAAATALSLGAADAALAQSGMALGDFRHPTLASPSYDPVRVLLALAIDGSGSVSETEWDIQKQATADALRSEEVRSAIRCPATGDPSAAVALIVFGTTAKLAIPFVDLRATTACREDDPEFDRRLNALAGQIEDLPRSIINGSTNIGDMLKFAYEVFYNAPWKPTERRVLDVAGDGKDNAAGSPAVKSYRDALMEYGVTINGIVLLTDEKDLADWFAEWVISDKNVKSSDGLTTSGQGGVWVVAENDPAKAGTGAGILNMSQRAQWALMRKLTTEIAGVYPSPGTRHAYILETGEGYEMKRAPEHADVPIFSEIMPRRPAAPAP